MTKMNKMANKLFNKVILDADICIKLSKISKLSALIRVLSQITDEVYIHEYVDNQEILSDRDQLNELIKTETVKVIYPETYFTDRLTIETYKAVFEELYEEIIGDEDIKKRPKHLGEVYSLALAKVLQIPVFMCDEFDMQDTINRTLNTGIDDIIAFRLRDLILWMKNNSVGFTRKEARVIYCRVEEDETNREKKIKERKKWFDSNWNLI